MRPHLNPLPGERKLEIPMFTLIVSCICQIQRNWDSTTIILHPGFCRFRDSGPAYRYTRGPRYLLNKQSPAD